ncbi:MAG: heme o synthase [Alicyclobacillus sp.]|nr:heme o synthase [Alicyclobacillus sp.]
MQGMAEKRLRREEAHDGTGKWRDYISLMKLGITAANLMATVAGLWMGAHGHPVWRTVVLTLIGTALVVASGATLNNFVDRDIDIRMERTSGRALPSGKVQPVAALVIGLVLGAVGLALLAGWVNGVAAACAFVGLVMYAYIYTVWLKRTTTLSTVLGGLAGAMPPLVGYAAGSGGHLDLVAWVVFSIFFLWQPPHFLPLAMKRVEDYRAAGIPMLPVVRGYTETKWQILVYTAAMVPVSLLLYALRAAGVIYLLVAVVLGVIFLWRAVQGLFTKDDLAWANRLFGFSLVYLTGMCLAMIVNPL